VNTFREHILSKLATILLVATLLTPSVVKIAHVFADHEHEICTVKNVEHLHEADIECEFYKYKLSGKSYISQSYTDFEPIIEVQKSIPFYYTFLNTHQQLNVSLRGPPSA